MKQAILCVLIIAAAAVVWALTVRMPSATPTPTATPTPAFTPDPEVIAWASGVLAQKPWLEARSSDANVPPGASPATTFIVSRIEPVVTREGNEWKITFAKPAP